MIRMKTGSSGTSVPIYLYSLTFHNITSLELTIAELLKEFLATFGTRNFIKFLLVRHIRGCNYPGIYGYELLARLPTPKLEDRPLSAVQGC